MNNESKKAPVKKNKKPWRKLKTLPAMATLEPFIMKTRIGSQNLMQDKINVAKAEEYIREKREQGMKNFSMMHLIIASYIRTCAERPALNRFVRGQRIYTRDDVEVALTIKLEMSIDSPDTVVKITLPKDATAEDVYNALNKVIVDYRENPGGDFDKVAGALARIPALIMKFFIWILFCLDYFGLIPKLLTTVSPFHCSFFITSMGSLGIPPIFHHLYNFGTCPIFCSFGAKQRAYKIDSDGNITKESYIEMGYALDERICDGFYFASSYKILKSIMKNPWVLDNPPETVVEDIR